MSDTTTSIVVDVGSGYMKAGLSSNEEPACVFPSIVGKPRRRYLDNYPGAPCFTGEEAVEARKQLSLFYPIDHGHIEDWSMMDELWSHVFVQQPNLDPEKYPVLITQPPLTSKLHKQRIAEAMFDVYNTSELCLEIQGVLSLYASAKTNGVCVEIGEGVTQVVPIIDGVAYHQGIRRIDSGGQELTMYLQKLLCNNGLPFTTRDDFEYVRLIKETYCYVALDPTTEDLRDDLSTTFTLPDGFELRDGTKQVTLGPEKFYCPEALFNPSLIDKDHGPLYELIMEAFTRAPIDFRVALLENIVLSGGSTVFRGLADRLTQDLSHVVPPSKQSSINVTMPDNGVYAAWQGGKIVADLKDSQPHMWLSSQEYQEMGASRCFENQRNVI